MLMERQTENTTDIDNAAKRCVELSLQACYRRRKYLTGSHDGTPTGLNYTSWRDIERTPRHYIKTSVQLCPRQKAKRLKVSGG